MTTEGLRDNTLIMLKGLPASGKSTFAKELIEKGYKRVNKDDLRAMLDNSKWNRANEEWIKHFEEQMVVDLLIEGENVVVDSTNFAYEERWRKCADNLGVYFEVKNFNVPVMECIERDAKRGDKSVGAKVIMQMYNQYLKPKRPEFVDGQEHCYIFDIDGTLALSKNRSPYDWKKVGQDEANTDVAIILDELRRTDAPNKIIILSGRDSICRPETEAWLKKEGIKYDALYMRAEGDSRKDSIVKKELYEAHILGKYSVLGVFDDRNQVVDLWRSLGLTCFQVAYGFF